MSLAEMTRRTVIERPRIFKAQRSGDAAESTLSTHTVAAPQLSLPRPPTSGRTRSIHRESIRLFLPLTVGKKTRIQVASA